MVSARAQTLTWRERGKVKGRLLCLHATFKAKHCTDISGLYHRCKNLLANIITWSHPYCWIKCKNPRAECLKHHEAITRKPHSILMEAQKAPHITTLRKEILRRVKQGESLDTIRVDLMHKGHAKTDIQLALRRIEARLLKIFEKRGYT